jgi:hypothetical protein
MTGIDQRSQLGTGFAPETRMNTGIGVPTIPVATALRQRNKVRAAPPVLARFSKTPLCRKEPLAQIGDIDTDRAIGTTSASPGAPHETPPTTSPATFTDLEPELGDIVKQLIDFVADSKMGLPQPIAGRFMAPVRRTSPGGLPVVRL